MHVQGGMTELEEAEPTDGQGRALSGHKTAQAYRGYAKETMQRALVQLASDMRICWRRSNSNTRAMMQLQFKIQQPASPWRVATLHNCVRPPGTGAIVHDIPYLLATRTNCLMRAPLP
jgi:hypothetical protein